MQYIGVIDCNNFFVSCERLFRPDLIGKPVMVLSSNDGCVVARSQEIKDMGIQVGVPYFQIKDIIKKSGTTVFSSHFTLYRDLSMRVFTVVREVCPDMEQYSIDEVFFTVTAPSLAAAQVAMANLKKLVEQRVGIPVSIGLSATKTQAKYANKLAKKAGGVVVLGSADWKPLAARVPLSEIWGVGGRLSRRYQEAGIPTVAALLSCPKLRLQSLFGVSGVRLQAELNGQAVYLVGAASAAQKSLMSSRSFPSISTDIRVLKDAVAYHIRSGAADLRRLGLRAGLLQVTIVPSRYSDYAATPGSLKVKFIEPTAATAILLQGAMGLVEQLFVTGVPYKKAGIILSQLTSITLSQASLFESSEVSGLTRLDAVIDALNHKFGRETLQLGRHNYPAVWVARSNTMSPQYTTNWQELAVVKAYNQATESVTDRCT
jgi:DNA polymerase V